MGEKILPGRLKSIREAQCLTQKDLAEETGLSQNTICKYENGNYVRYSPNFKRIANFFGVSLEWLVGDEFVGKECCVRGEIDNMVSNGCKNLPLIAYKLRTRAGKTVSEVSQGIGVSTYTIYSIENGMNIPRLDTAARLAAYYKVSLDTLFGYCAE